MLGAFGHTVFGGMSLVYLVMARDTAHRATYAGLLDDVQNTPVMLFAMVGPGRDGARHPAALDRALPHPRPLPPPSPPPFARSQPRPASSREAG